MKKSGNFIIVILLITVLILVNHILLITHSISEQPLRMLYQLLVAFILMNSDKFGPDRLFKIIANITKVLNV